ncbi:alpha-amylase family glycosyl hydrolase [Gordonia sp. OPL2]|uniref:alpha-amylase family glycosyl hydrolase n=1 Tax=Gordonia sp. OPL2 TaxID=2486274 RepID=UPI0016562306|nr:alpha-amylase family glycosyl hydrolase [Gordonia sp. OPL2]ROZ89421.1 alpha-amylase [Gordonia sp. OPL2]
MHPVPDDAGPVRIPAWPLIYEINTWPWLTALSRAAGRSVTLADVPDDEWDGIADRGFDAVWLMGVWRRSPAGVAIARADDPLMAWFASTMPDFEPGDVVGSPYSVRDYIVDDHLGGPAALATARRALADRGVGLILDLVPNHVAVDHPWVAEHPDWFIRGSADDLDRDPLSFVAVGDAVIANGRDPYFPAWRDVVQVNAFSDGLRAATRATVTAIAARCDGVRCDMAMLVRNDVFARTWGERAGPIPDDEFWPPVIEGVRARYPDFVFIAEAYWDTEPALLADGFDQCYDKRFYDAVRDAPTTLREVMSAGPPAGRHLLRFIENHDEPRAPVAFGDRDRQAAVAALTQAGPRLIHQGQLDGRRRRLPVQLGRFADEPVDTDRALFYRALLGLLATAGLRDGRLDLCGTDDAAPTVIAWTRTADDDRWLIVLNVSDETATGRIPTGWADLPSHLRNPLSGERVPVADDGSVEVSLVGWGWQIYR